MFLMGLTDVFLDVLLLLSHLVLASADYAEYCALNYLGLAQEIGRFVVEVRIEVELGMSTHNWHWLHQILRGYGIIVAVLRLHRGIKLRLGIRLCRQSVCDSLRRSWCYSRRREYALGIIRMINGHGLYLINAIN